ncbi:MAG: hypothetical protein CME71_10225 [Halobacteriovorax sp.]|nr:hypothetical protein [Halobacteriovorax sp.]
MTHSTNLFRYLDALTPLERESVLLQNGLLGYAYECPQLRESVGLGAAKTQFLKQWQQNQGYLSFLSHYGSELSQIDASITLLKGCALLSDVYKDSPGSRFMSDIDLLVDASNLSKLLAFFESVGLRPSDKSVWFGDRHKVELHGEFNGIQLTIELHTKLFFHQEKFAVKTTKCFEFYQKLSTEYQLVHLIAHYCFQHTMLKLYWFVDIALFIEANKSTIDWKLVDSIARQWGVYQSLCYSLGAINQHWDKIAPSYLGRFQFLIDEEFLASNHQRSLKYLFLKNMFKDSWKLNLQYSLGWLRRHN